MSMEVKQKRVVEWTGAASDNWNDPENWEPKVVPTMDDEVVAKPGSTIDITGVDGVYRLFGDN